MFCTLCFGGMSVMIVSTLVFAVLQARQLLADETRRIYRGVDDSAGKYPYVVALVKEYRRCTGTLISPNWVLTAAHCLTSATHIQYGNMTVPFKDSDSKRQILMTEQPPAPYMMVPDLGLIYVNTVPMKKYGMVSAVDYKAIQGHAIEYAGYGFTQKEYTKDIERIFKMDQVRPLQLGSGVATMCEEKEFVFVPYLCVAPKCTEKEQQTLPGDPGGPLFYDGKVAGVHIGSQTLKSIRYYTPLSPYLTWIHQVISKPHNFQVIHRASIDNASTPIQYIQYHNVSRYLYGLKLRLRKYREKVLSVLLRELV